MQTIVENGVKHELGDASNAIWQLFGRGVMADAVVQTPQRAELPAVIIQHVTANTEGGRTTHLHCEPLPHGMSVSVGFL